MFVYIIYNKNTLDICRIHTDETECHFDFMYNYTTPCDYDWKAINLDALFKLYKNEIINS